GQVHHCTFCGLNGSTMTFRSKSPERAFEEIGILVERYPGLPVLVVDNIMDMRYLGTLLPRLQQLDRPVELFYEVKANLRKGQLQQLSASHVTMIQPGIESLSTPILKLMCKGVTAIQNLQLLKWCKELGIRPEWNFLCGFPGEPTREYARMAELV